MMQIIEARDYTEDHIAKLLGFAKVHGGVEYAYEKMDAYLAEADRILSEFTFNSEFKTLMHLFISYLKDRVY